MNKFLICFGMLAITSCASSTVSKQTVSYADPMQYMSINFDLSKQISYIGWEGAKDIVTSPISGCSNDQAYAFCIVSDHLPLFVLPNLTEDGDIPTVWDFEDTKFELVETWKNNHSVCSYRIVSNLNDNTDYRHVFLYDTLSGLKTIFFLSLDDANITDEDFYITHDALYAKHTGLGANVVSPTCFTNP